MQRLNMHMAAGSIGSLLLCLCWPVAGAQLQARLDWAQQVELATPVSGVVGQVNVKPGQRVKQGDLLLELDQRLFRSSVSRAKARLEEARQMRAEASREQERTMELFERTLLSEHDRELADIALSRAKATYSAAHADYTEAGVKLEYSRLSAPFDAWVTQVAVSTGETVVNRLEAKTLVSLAAAGRMRAVARLDGKQLGTVSGGSPVTVLVAAERYSAVVDGVSLEPVGHTAQGPEYALEVSFELPNGVLLRAGQAAVIEWED